MDSNYRLPHCIYPQRITPLHMTFVGWRLTLRVARLLYTFTFICYSPLLFIGVVYCSVVIDHVGDGDVIVGVVGVVVIVLLPLLLVLTLPTGRLPLFLRCYTTLFLLCRGEPTPFYLATL